MNFDHLLELQANQLDELFKSSPPGDIPNGQAEGRAIIAPGSWLARVLAQLIHSLAWQGKVFDARQGSLRNRLLPFGIRAIAAKVAVGKSWLDEKDCIVLDYSKTSFVAQRIRDEIRLIAPRIYLGVVYWGKTRLIHFALRFPG